MQGSHSEINIQEIVVSNKIKFLSESNFRWAEKCRKILFVCKDDDSVNIGLKLILNYLLTKYDDTRIYLSEANYEFVQKELSKSLTERCEAVSFAKKIDHLPIDLVITLGGDGTLLYLSSLFQSVHPPVLSFYMGSLGFLTNFDVDQFETTLPPIIEGPVSCILRSRLRCEIIRSVKSDTYSKICNQAFSQGYYLSEIYGSAMRLPEACTNSNSEESAFSTLNEVVVHRGLSPFLLVLKLFVNGKEITEMQGDGLLISTPTGSTAYAMSAGATMLHPSVPAIMITPINPHTLNCRPICLPTNAVIELELASSARSKTAHVNCDGQTGGYSLISKDDRLRITNSEFPMPCICSDSQVSDWFSGLAQCLNWNVRHQQSQFNFARFTEQSQSTESMKNLSISKK